MGLARLSCPSQTLRRARPLLAAVLALSLTAGCNRPPATNASAGGTVKVPVDSVAFSPDGKLLAATFNFEIPIWDAATGTEKVKIKASSGAKSLTWSPDGKLLAAACADKTVQIWDVSGEQRHSLTGFKSYTEAVAWSPDGKLMVVSACDPNPYNDQRGNVRSEIRLWDPQAGKQIEVLKNPGDACYAIAFAPDGAYFVTGHFDGRLRLWDPAERKQRREPIAVSERNVLAVAFRPDGKQLATAGLDAMITLWDTDTWKEVGRLKGHEDRVNAVAYVAGGKYLVSASDDGSVRVWDPATQAEKGRLLRGGPRLHTAAAQAKGQAVACGGAAGMVRVWELPGGDITSEPPPRFDLRP